MKRLTVAALAIAMLASCAKETIEPTGSGEVNFSTQSVVARLDAGGTSWTSNDRIGITMSAGPYLEYKSTVSGTTTTFTAVNASNQHVYPRSGTVYFDAYYPFQAGTDPYTTNLADQSAGIGAHDFMAARRVSNCQDGDVVNFEFLHKLAKVYIKVSCDGEVVTSLDGLKVTLKGMAKKLYLKTGEVCGSVNKTTDIIAYTVVAGDNKTATVEAIIDIAAVDNEIVFTLNKDYSETLTIASPEAGTVYNYTAMIGMNEVKFGSSVPVIGSWGSKESSELTGLE